MSWGSGSPIEPIAANVISLWQANSVGIVCRRRIGYCKVRDNAVCVITVRGGKCMLNGTTVAH